MLWRFGSAISSSTCVNASLHAEMQHRNMDSFVRRWVRSEPLQQDSCVGRKLSQQLRWHSRRGYGVSPLSMSLRQTTTPHSSTTYPEGGLARRGASVDLAPLLLLPDASLDAILGGGLPLLPPLPMSNSMTSPMPSAALSAARTKGATSGGVLQRVYLYRLRAWRPFYPRCACILHA